VWKLSYHDAWETLFKLMRLFNRPGSSLASDLTSSLSLVGGMLTAKKIYMKIYPRTSQVLEYMQVQGVSYSACAVGLEVENAILQLNTKHPALEIEGRKAELFASQWIRKNVTKCKAYRVGQNTTTATMVAWAEAPRILKDCFEDTLPTP
jgi:hypothetical protein